MRPEVVPRFVNAGSQVACCISAPAKDSRNIPPTSLSLINHRRRSTLPAAVLLDSRHQTTDRPAFVAMMLVCESGSHVGELGHDHQRTMEVYKSAHKKQSMSCTPGYSVPIIVTFAHSFVHHQQCLYSKTETNFNLIVRGNLLILISTYLRKPFVIPTNHINCVFRT
jgi:hypothetical protein